MSPHFFSDNVYKWLDNALDYGIPEKEFWNMTLDELNRASESQMRQRKAQLQEQAYLDYTLGILIGKSVSRLFSNSATYPEIYDAYPTLFDREEIEEATQEKRDELSAIRFQQFANFYNEKFKEGGK